MEVEAREHARLEKSLREFEKKTRGKVFDDPDFGRLTFDLAWEGEVTIEPLGSGMVLAVETDALADDLTHPTEPQRRAFILLTENAGNLRATIQQRVFDYYNQGKDEFREWLLDDAEEHAPDLNSSDDIWKLLENPPELTIGYDSGQSPIEIILSYGCTWDDEHALAVTVEDGVVTDVSPR